MGVGTPHKPQRVLLVYQLAKLGDILLITPTLAAIKKAMPHCHITCWIPKSTHDALATNPHVDRVWHADYRPTPCQILKLSHMVWKAQFDAVVLLKHNSGSYTVISTLARIPVRAGNAETTKYYSRFLTHNFCADPWLEGNYHWVQYIAAVTQPTIPVPLQPGNIEVHIPHEAQGALESQVSRLIGNDRPYFCVHPGTGGSSHPWYPERYGEVSKILQRITGFKVVVTGSEKEKDLAETVCRIVGRDCFNLAGKTSFLALATLLQGARCLVSGDTGVVHVAAAFGVPTVIVHTVSDYHNRLRLFHPWNAPYRFVAPHEFCDYCSPAYCLSKGDRCLLSIRSDEVVKAVLDLLVSVEKDAVRE